MKVNAPLVTVITPTYNRAAFLRETAASILAQTYPLIEYLIIDDGSTDDTGAVAAEITSREGRTVRFIKQPQSGEAAAINRGWELASGDYVAVVSSDDPQPPDWLQICVSYLEARPHAAVGYPDWTMIDEKGEPLETIRLPEFNRETMIEMLQCYPGPGTLIRRSLVNDAALRRTGFIHCSDFDCYLRLSLSVDFVHIPFAAANWRDHQHGFSAANGIVWYKDMRRILQDFFARNDLPEKIRSLRKITEANLSYEAARKIWRQNLLMALWLLIRSFWDAPSGRRLPRYWPDKWSI